MRRPNGEDAQARARPSMSAASRTMAASVDCRYSPRRALPSSFAAIELMRPRRVWSRRHENQLLHAECDELVHQPQQARRPIAQPMRFAAPVRFGRERHRVIAARERHGKRRRDGVGEMIPSRPGQIDDARSTRFRFARRRPAHQIATSRLGHQREDDVGVRVDVVGGNHELSKARLAQILGEQFNVPAAEIDRDRAGSRAPRRAPDPRARPSSARRHGRPKAATGALATRTARAGACAGAESKHRQTRRRPPCRARARRASAATSGALWEQTPTAQVRDNATRGRPHRRRAS